MPDQLRVTSGLLALGMALAASQAAAGGSDSPGQESADSVQDMSMDGEIVTVRPDQAVMTRQSLPNFVGVGRETAGAAGLSMNLVVIPPGAKADAHYHRDFETAIYVLEGKVETRYGKGLAKSTVNVAGDFLFIPPGVPHQPANLSADEPARAIVARNDPDEQENVVPYESTTSQ